MEKCSKCGDVANIRMYGIDYCASCMLKVFNNGFQNKEIKKEDKIMERHICKHCEKSIDVDTTNDYVEYEEEEQENQLLKPIIIDFLNEKTLY